MGAGSSDERGDTEAPVTLQQQRAQFLLIQQIQEARMLARNENAAAGATALTSLGWQQPPVDQPALLMSKVLHNPAHLRGKSILLTSGQPGDPMTLSFSFDAIAPCVVTVYRSALLTPAVYGGWEVESAAWSSPPVPFQAGLAQSHLIEWEALWQSQAVSATFESDARHCPMLIELRVEDPKLAPSSVEWTICQLLTVRNSNSGKTRVEVVSQQFCNGSNQALELLDFFGSEPVADNITRQDCIVCQSEPRDTAVLPCRHLCLCHGCSDYIRTRTQFTSYKCPICREKIGRMMRIEPDDAGVAASSSQEKAMEDAQLDEEDRVFRNEVLSQAEVANETDVALATAA